MKTRRVVTPVQNSPQLTHFLHTTCLSVCRLFSMVIHSSSYIDNVFKIGQFNIDPPCYLTPSPFWKHLICAINFLSVFQEPGIPAGVSIWLFYLFYPPWFWYFWTLWGEFNMVFHRYFFIIILCPWTSREGLLILEHYFKAGALFLISSQPLLSHEEHMEWPSLCFSSAQSRNPTVYAAVWTHKARETITNKRPVFVYVLSLSLESLHSQTVVSIFLSPVFLHYLTGIQLIRRGSK